MVGEEVESGRWLMPADPWVVLNRREGVCVCVDASFDFEAFLNTLVSLDDRRGGSALSPLIDVGWGLNDIDRVRRGGTRALEVGEPTSGVRTPSEKA